MVKACKQCQFLTEEAICPHCGTPTSKQWSGFLSIIDAEESELAAAMNIQRPGNYALKVR